MVGAIRLIPSDRPRVLVFLCATEMYRHSYVRCLWSGVYGRTECRHKWYKKVVRSFPGAVEVLSTNQGGVKGLSERNGAKLSWSRVSCQDHTVWGNWLDAPLCGWTQKHFCFILLLSMPSYYCSCFRVIIDNLCCCDNGEKYNAVHHGIDCVYNKSQKVTFLRIRRESYE